MWRCKFLALVTRQSAALSFATQHAISCMVGKKWGTECLNIIFSFMPPYVEHIEGLDVDFMIYTKRANTVL